MVAGTPPSVDCHVRLRDLGRALAQRRERTPASGSRLDREEREAHDLVGVLDLMRDARATLAGA